MGIFRRKAKNTTINNYSGYSPAIDREPPPPNDDPAEGPSDGSESVLWASERGKVDFYQDANDLWRWTLTAGNYKIMSDSGEGYATLANAKRAFRRVREIVESLEEA